MANDIKPPLTQAPAHAHMAKPNAAPDKTRAATARPAVRGRRPATQTENHPMEAEDSHLGQDGHDSLDHGTGRQSEPRSLARNTHLTTSLSPQRGPASPGARTSVSLLRGTPPAKSKAGRAATAASATSHEVAAQETADAQRQWGERLIDGALAAGRGEAALSGLAKAFAPVTSDAFARQVQQWAATP